MNDLIKRIEEQAVEIAELKRQLAELQATSVNLDLTGLTIKTEPGIEPWNGYREQDRYYGDKAWRWPKGKRSAEVRMEVDYQTPPFTCVVN